MRGHPTVRVTNIVGEPERLSMRISRTVIPIKAAAPTTTTVLAARRNRVQAAVADRYATIRNSTSTIVSLPDKDVAMAGVLDRLPKERREVRKGTHVHVSDLLGKCIRKIAICDRERIAVAPDRLSVSDQLTYAQGDAIHDVIKMMATRSEPRQVWGNWTCDCGHLFHDVPCTQSKTDPTDLCPLCNTPTHKYKEVPMFDDLLLIVGNPDLLRWIASVEAFCVSEIKSMAADAWKEITRPLPAHIVQVVFYWYLMHKLGYRMVDRISVIYATKGYVFRGKPYKEFIINPLDELHRLTPYLEMAEALVVARNGGALPPRLACAGEDSPKARSCEACAPCFAAA